MSMNDLARAPAPRERPIFFSGPMVRALLAGHKTQTRRLVKIPAWITKRGLHPRTDEWMGNRYTKGSGQYPGGNPQFTGDQPSGLLITCLDGTCQLLPCPYGVSGERLWVRETWKASERAADMVDGIQFAADGSFIPIENSRAAADRWGDVYDNGRHGARCWRPPIFMPRWASRINLEVTGIRLERLQAITEADAAAEGVEKFFDRYAQCSREQRICTGELALAAPYRASFACTWDEINGDRDLWSSNPWVWAIVFKRLRS
jgi:hypothetical protein